MIHVAFNVDENFIDKCKVVIRSILANTTSDVTFHVVGTHFDMDGVRIICYEKPDMSKLPQIVPVGEITVAAGYRMFFPDILDLDKVIYIDCDTIVLQDIAELWKYQPKYIAGVLDPMHISQAKKIGIDMPYINSGVMVMNLKGLREFHFLEKCSLVDTKKYRVTLPDQDVMNIVLKDVLQHLPYKWNVYALGYEETTKGMFEARKNPAIIHWCGSRKPWKPLPAWKMEEWKKYAE